MARLLKRSIEIKFRKQRTKEDLVSYWMKKNKVEQFFIEENSDNIIKLRAADGYAYYMINSRTPLTLQHINCGDGWVVPDYSIRGLRLQDVETMIEMDKVFNNLSAKKEEQ